MKCIKSSFIALSAIIFLGVPALAKDIKVSTKGEQLAFEPAEFEVKPGEKVTLTFVNQSVSMEHNLVIGKPGTAAKIGADSQAAGAANAWTSSGPEVLFKTKMLKPGTKTKPNKETITFTAPTEKGMYPYLCTFPGHSMFMKGNMNVK